MLVESVNRGGGKWPRNCDLRLGVVWWEVPEAQNTAALALVHRLVHVRVVS